MYYVTATNKKNSITKSSQMSKQYNKYYLFISKQDNNLAQEIQEKSMTSKCEIYNLKV